MEPQWHQDINTKGIQPKHLPQFEAAGQQQDYEYRKKATQMVVTAVGLVAVSLIFLTVVTFLPTAFKEHRSSFGRIQTNTQKKQKFKDRIVVRIHKLTRSNEVPGQLFTKVKSRENFTFLIVDVSVVNRANETFMLNPFSFGLYTKDGKAYKTALNTHHHPDRLKAQKIKPKDQLRGVLLFQIPSFAHLDSLELMGATDTITLVQI